MQYCTLNIPKLEYILKVSIYKYMFGNQYDSINKKIVAKYLIL